MEPPHRCWRCLRKGLCATQRRSTARTSHMCKPERLLAAKPEHQRPEARIGGLIGLGAPPKQEALPYTPQTQYGLSKSIAIRELNLRGACNVCVFETMYCTNCGQQLREASNFC